MNQIHTVCVYSASSDHISPLYHEAAVRLGALLAVNGITLVNGAGRMGLMAATTNAALAAGGKAIGVIPRFMVDRGWHHDGMTELRIVADMHERKQTMASLSDAVVALPGGCGTLEELMEVITWKQLGLYTGPIIILNTGGYYDALLRMLNTAISEGFMRRLHEGLWRVATTPDEVIRLLHDTPPWDPTLSKFAAITR